MTRRYCTTGPLLLAAGIATASTGCYDRADYSPTESLVRSILALESTSGETSLPADGFSRLRLVARVATDTALDKRAVLFSTTDGTLVGGTGDGDARRVDPDGDGRAAIDLRSSSRVGAAVVTARLEREPGIAASLAVEFIPVDPAGILRFVAVPVSAPADGATVSALTVEVSPQLPAESREVEFRTTAGSFAPGGGTEVTVPADAGNRATADLRSAGEPTAARIRATAAGVTREVVVEFVPALPDDLTLVAVPPAVAAGPGASVELTATLHRRVGSATPGTKVTFAADAGGFSNAEVLSGPDGTAATTFFPRAEAAGRIAVTASALGAGGGMVTGTVVVEVVGGG